MKVGFGLTLEQTQKLIMTPELRQAITVLQLSSLELSEYIIEQLETNPLLEIAEEEHQEKTEQKEEEKFDIDWREYFQDRSDLGYVNYKEREDQENSYENFVHRGPTLQDHFLSQLRIVLFNVQDLKIGEFIIGSLDKNGYLRIETEKIAELLKVDINCVERILGIIQNLDPVGVGARTLEECLLIQVRYQKIDKLYLEDVIINNLNELGEGRYSKIAEAYGITLKDVQDIGDIIKKLEPKPGRNFADSEVRYVTPDVTVEKVSGEYIVLVNDTIAPRLMVNSYYKSMLQKKEDSQEVNQFLNGRLDSALWLIKSIEQRRMTLHKVVKTIVDLQRDFFDKGIMYLKPMTLKEVAEIIGMHESTVSRATSGKYVQTPRGVFDLKFFFSSGVSNNEGDGTSSESIKKMIGDLVKTEDIHHPLSDQKIVEIMKANKINISRRTVAKYRDDIGIPSSNKRKRY